MNGNIDGLVDRGGDEEAAETLVLGRQIGSAAAETDAQW
jgi:hypothetical protein